MSRILCPNCGIENDDPEGARSSQGFCVGCDFPLFFGRGEVKRPEDDTDSARVRMPGVNGMSRRSWIPCPDCGELNPKDGVNCLRCGALLVIPEEEVEPELVPTKTVIREILVPAAPRRRWLLSLLSALAGSAITIIIYLLAVWIW
jgi:hypothetical protein